MFEEFERRYGDKLPIVRGDFTRYWEDGAASTAAETAANRASAGRLLQAEALWSILGKDGFPADKIYEAWRQRRPLGRTHLGRGGQRSDPDGENARTQWEYKKAFATEAVRMSGELLEEASKNARRGTSAADRESVDVVNTCSWERTDLVVLPAGMSKAGDLVKDATGTAVPSQRLRTGELAFLASAVPGFGAKRYFVSRAGLRPWAAPGPRETRCQTGRYPPWSARRRARSRVFAGSTA